MQEAETEQVSILFCTEITICSTTLGSSDNSLEGIESKNVPSLAFF